MNNKLLLISNSTNPGEEYLGWPRTFIKDFLNKYGIKKVLFVPYAGITVSYDDYTAKVKSVFNGLGFEIRSVHETDEPHKSVHEAEAIAVGGGNTWRLVHELQQTGLMQSIKEKVFSGTPYLGWSAGSNVACPTLRTTNDMPVIQPPSFRCMDLIPFQINPHYLDTHPSNHGGETREQRIEEFIALNQNLYVAGLRESTLLELENKHLLLKGRNPMRIFRSGLAPQEVSPGENIDFLLAH
ncbi:MAG: dipeptidase PepE [Bacteroidetes bacterium]|nr:dipeptidase PepE [Bacteroidota bacterium]